MSATLLTDGDTTVDAAQWVSFLRHVRIQLMLVGTGELAHYGTLRAQGAHEALLMELYPFDWEQQCRRLRTQVELYGTHRRFIPLFEKMVDTSRNAPEWLPDLWSRPDLGYAGRLGDPLHRTPTATATARLTLAVERLYKHTDMRKRHTSWAAERFAGSYIKFIARFQAVETWADLAVRFYPQPDYFEATEQSLAKFIKRLDRVCAYKPQVRA